MITNKRLGVDAPWSGQNLPSEVMAQIFGNMYLQPHAGTPDGMRDMLGLQLPRPVFALDHDAPVLPDDQDQA